MISKIIRVAVNNNFNCTTNEFKQLDILSNKHLDYFFFVNSNIKTPYLLNINDHNYKAVITVNPDIITDNLVQRLYDIAIDKIAFVRVKYIPGDQAIISLIKTLSKKYQVVVTMQRFNGKKSISQYVPDYTNHYTWSCNRYRLNDKSKEHMLTLLSTFPNTYICDRSGLGCQGCGLCSTLTLKKKLPVYSMNMSSSGLCPFNCTDCYAKTMQHFLKSIGVPSMRFDWIHQNEKQKGNSEHIKLTKIKLSRKALA
jgi:hypothetical protein